MHKALPAIVEIQELDMQLIQLMRLKNKHKRELEHLNKIKSDLNFKASLKEEEIKELKTQTKLLEGDVKTITEGIKDLESKQNQIKKVEEFNALSKEISQAERERTGKEQRLSDYFDKLSIEEDILNELSGNLASTTESSEGLISEINESIEQINAEGQEILIKRNQKVKKADPEIFPIYERLLRNKKDRVIVPIENRCCTGCHIMVTAQDENLVRKGERLVFCEHCSRIHYWPEEQEVEGTTAAPKRRRRTQKATTS